MKKTALIISAVIMFLLLSPFFNGYAKDSEPGDECLYEDIPLIQEGYDYYIRPQSSGEGYVAMLPLSTVLYEYADISYEEEQGIVHVTCGTLDAIFEIGETVYVINGETSELDSPPEIIDGQVYIPATFFEKTFGFWITGKGDGFIDLFMPSFIIDNI